MILLRRAKERRHDRRRKQEVWNTFAEPPAPDGEDGGFGALAMFAEERLPPGGEAPRRRHHDAEVVTYVREGSLAFEDSMGRSGVIHAGEFQRATSGRGTRRGESNPSRTDASHVFQIGLRSAAAGLDASLEQKRFSASERRGGLLVVASPDARRESLRIHQDAVIYASMLDAGQHVVHELAQGRTAWLHLVVGEVTLGDMVLTAGDGAGVTQELSVSLTAREGTELLLVNLGEPPAQAREA